MSEPSTKRTPIGRLGLLFLGALIVVPMVLLVECGHTGGELTVSGGPQDDFVIEPSDCHSLLPYGSHGAALHGARENTGAVYVIVDPSTRGREIHIEVPGSCDDDGDCSVLLVMEEACTTFDVQIDNTLTTVNDVTLVKGHATLECTLQDGTNVSGHLDFDGC